MTCKEEHCCGNVHDCTGPTRPDNTTVAEELKPGPKLVDPSDPREVTFRASIRDVAYEMFLDLRETLKSHYRPKDLGYMSVEHARLIIISNADKKILKMSADHLKKVGK